MLNIMKNVIISIVFILACFAGVLSAQSKEKTRKPVTPYWGFELSTASTLAGSMSHMEENMKQAGYGGTYYYSISILGINFSTTTTYPIVDKKSGYMLSLRYQYNHTHGVTAKYGLAEDYTITGSDQGIDFQVHNQVSTAAILYTLSTPNQRLKASVGPSYSWMKSTSVNPYASKELKSTSSGTLGLKLNTAFSFIQNRHFFLAYYFDFNITGKVEVGPYFTGNNIWEAPDMSISSIIHGLSCGFTF